MKIFHGPEAAASVLFPGAECLVLLPAPAKSRGLLDDPLGPKSLQLLKTSSDQISRAFLVKQYLTGKKPKVGEVRRWLPTFLTELEFARPERILVTDADIMRLLCPDFKSLTEDHGTFFPWEGRWLVPTYRLSLSAQDPDFDAIIRRDIQRFFTVNPREGSHLPDAVVVTSSDEIPSFFFQEEQIVIDIETSGLNYTDSIHYVGMYAPTAGQIYILAGSPIDSEELDLLEKRFPISVQLVLHNAKFDLGMLSAKSPGWTRFLDVVDTMLLAHNAGEKTKSLKHLMSLYTDMAGSRGQGDVYSIEYLVQDLIGTWQIYQHFRAQQETVSGSLMGQMSAVLGYLQTRGIYIDRTFLSHIRDEYSLHLDDMRKKLDKLGGAGVNWDSPQQVVEALLQAGVKLTEKTQGGALSVAEGVLQALLPVDGEDGIIATLLDYRGMQKLLTGFILPFLDQGMDYVYPSLLLHGTETGRLSCKGPNLQQIPRKGPLKQIFRSRWEGGLYGLIDLSQAELRGAALLSDDEVFAAALETEDAHRAIAAKVFHKAPEDITPTERKKSKQVTFSTLYGSSAAGIAYKMGIPLEEAQELQRGLFARFKKLNYWAKGIQESVQWASRPFLIRTAFGRTRNLSTILHHEGTKGAYRKAINTGPQSLASDTMLWIMRSIYLYLVQNGYRSRPLFPVHDSTLLEIYPGEVEAVKAAVQYAFQSLWDSPLSRYELFSRLPFRGELIIGQSWAEVESTNEAYKPISITPVSSERTEAHETNISDLWS